MGVCTVVVAGNLGSKPELKDAGSSQVCSFRMAHNRRSKGEDFTDWYSVDAWGKLGELCARYLDKGSKVVVSGQLSQRAYTTKDGEDRLSLDINAQDVQFMDSRDETPGRSTSAPAGEAQMATGSSDDEDIPF